MALTERRDSRDEERATMGNIATWLKESEKETGETIEAIVVGAHDSCMFSSGNPLPDENVILSREDGLQKLDQDYDSGYGNAECFPMYAWTPSFVFFVGEYDGATGLNRVPRNPTACEPALGGMSS